MNKYLEKIAGFGKAVGHVADFAENVIGGKARKLASDAEAMARHHAAGNSAAKVQGMADEASTVTRNARIKAGLGAGVVGAGGFLGLHKYHQHKDRAIMDRLNTMYQDPNGQ